MKYAAIYLGATALLAISRAVDSTLEGVVLVGAALVGAGVIWQKGIKPAGRLLVRINAALDELFALKDWRRHVEHRLDQIEDKASADLTVKHDFMPPPQRPS